MKNKKSIALICAAVGVCMFTCAAAANYRVSNGYDTLKKSVLSTRDFQNCTLTAEMSIDFDGSPLSQGSWLYEIDLPNGMIHSRSKEITAKDISEGSSPYIYEYYDYNDRDYHSSIDEKGNTYYIMSNYYGSQENLWGIDKEDSKTADKVIKFAEAAADTVVGDLRNNFVCTEDTDEYSAYSITLDSVQIPEVINAGLSMLVSMSNSNNNGIDSDGNVIQPQEGDSDYYLMLMGDDTITDSAELNFRVGKDGVPQNGNLLVTFTGNGHTMTFNLALSLTDIGTTSIKTLEEQGAVIKAYSEVYEETEVPDEVN